MSVRPEPDRNTSLRELFIGPLWEQKRLLASLALALALLSLSQGLLVLLVGPLLKTMFGHGLASGAPVVLSDLLPSRLSWGAARQFKLSPRALVVGVPLALVVAGLAKGLASYAYNLGQETIALYVAKRYRERLFEALLAMPYVAIRARSPAEWMSIIMNDVLYLQLRFSDIMASFVRDGFLIISALVALTLIQWQIGLALFVVAPFAAFGLGRLARRIAHFAAAFQRELARLATAVLDVRMRFNFVRAQHGEARERELFDALNERYYRIIRRSIFLRSIFAPGLEFAGFAVFSGFLFALGRGYWQQSASPEFLMTFFAALGLVLRPLRNLGEQLTYFQETRGSLERSLDILKHVPAQKTIDAAPRLAQGKSLTISKINAGYVVGSQPRVLFTADDLTISPGKAIAIIGPSGAGKSTLLKTLAGLIEPLVWEGKHSWLSVKAQASMVSQDPFLFDDSLQENLIYGLSTLPSEERLWGTLQLVNVADEVNALPERLATRVNAIASNFSGGQVQRLVIARALLRDKALWLLDEATSAIDARSERDITLRLIEACHDRGQTLIAVTHRLQWLGHFDEVWFVEDGTVVARGRHEALLGLRRYRSFCQLGELAGEGR